MNRTPFELAARIFALVFLGLLGVLGMSWLFLPALWEALCLWTGGYAPAICYLIPPCLALAFTAGALIWVRETLENLRTAYGGIIAKLRTRIDRLERELAALKQDPPAPHSERED